MGSPGKNVDDDMCIGPAAVGHLCVDTQCKGHSSPWGRLVVAQHCLQGTGQEGKGRNRHDLMQGEEAESSAPPLPHAHHTTSPERRHSCCRGPAPRTAPGSLSVLPAAPAAASGG